VVFLTDIEKLENTINSKIETLTLLKKRRGKIMNLCNTQKRKERTRQLIQMGALVEKYFDIHDVTEFEKFLKSMFKKG
jgi:hypothetical protein